MEILPYNEWEVSRDALIHTIVYFMGRSIIPKYRRHKSLPPQSVYITW